MINRRLFILGSASLLASAACASQTRTFYANGFQPLKDPYQTIALVQEDLFPPSPGVPTVRQLNSIGFLKGAMLDERIAQSEKNFVVNGVEWLHEDSIKLYGKKYHLLLADERQKVLRHISEYRWGNNWLYTVMSYIFESMLCDPVYGANSGGAGWKWLEHEPGYPRPKRAFI